MLCADTSKGNRTTLNPQHCKMASQFSSEEERVKELTPRIAKNFFRSSQFLRQ
jgi:hypothetical protein